MASQVLRVRGSQIVDAAGTPVVLRGYNIGGWMNMENFLTGYPGTESQHRRALLGVLGPELYEAFFDRFMAVFFAEADAARTCSVPRPERPARQRQPDIPGDRAAGPGAVAARPSSPPGMHARGQRPGVPRAPD